MGHRLKRDAYKIQRGLIVFHVHLEQACNTVLEVSHLRFWEMILQCADICFFLSANPNA